MRLLPSSIFSPADRTLVPVLAVLLACCWLLAGSPLVYGKSRDLPPPDSQQWGNGRIQSLGQVTCPPATGKVISGNQDNVNFSAWPAGSLVNANFQGASLRGAIFAGQNLSGASFQNANLGPSDQGSSDFTNTQLNQACFIGATLDSTDFSYAVMTCTDFSYTSLLKATFGPLQNIQAGNNCRTRFIGSTLDIHAIALNNWGQVDFTDAIFINLSPAAFSLNGVDVTNAKLGCTTFTSPPAAGCKSFNGIDFTSANLTGADLSGASLVKAKLDSAALNGINLAHANLSNASLTCSRFYGSASIPNCLTQPPSSTNPNLAANLMNATVMYANFNNAVLDSSLLSGANITGGTYWNTSFQNASFEATQTVNAASIVGVDFTQANFSNAHIDNLIFQNVILTQAQFGSGQTLSGTDFTGAIMPSADFTGATLQGVKFNSAILENANFTNTLISKSQMGSYGANFTCAQLGGTNFTNSTINSANFTAAVMPPAPPGISPPLDCCAQKVGEPWCGTVDITQQFYGPVTYPALNASAVITCPNGDVGNCAGLQWVIPKWQTNLCNVNHTTTTVWTPPTCGSSGKNVDFSDLNFKQCILDSLPGKPSEVSEATAGVMQSINCPGKGIASLGGLDSFKNLVSLDLTANQITQFNANLPQLQTLKIADNQLTALDVSHLNGGAPVRLDASNNQLKTVVGLAQINLEVLDLSHNQLTQFDLPQQSQSLTYADLSYNQLTNVLDQFHSDLNNMTLLNYLDLSCNSVPTVGSVSVIANPAQPGGSATLMSLFLACNPTFQCQSLALPGGLSPASALMTSQCADVNTQNQNWTVLANPNCPVPCLSGRRKRH